MCGGRGKRKSKSLPNIAGWLQLQHPLDHAWSVSLKTVYRPLFAHARARSEARAARASAHPAPGAPPTRPADPAGTDPRRNVHSRPPGGRRGSCRPGALRRRLDHRHPTRLASRHPGGADHALRRAGEAQPCRCPSAMHKPVATRYQRKHQRTAASVLPESDGSLSAHPTTAGQSPTRTQQPTTCHA